MKLSIETAILAAACAAATVSCGRDDRALGTERDRATPTTPTTPPAPATATERRDDLGIDLPDGRGSRGDTGERTDFGDADRRPLGTGDGTAGVAQPASPTASAAIDAAITSLASARCEVAQKCGEVGPGEGKDHASREACISAVRKDLGDDLNASDCRGGIVQKELDECLAETRNQDCKNPIDALRKLAACRSSDLCKSIP